MVINYIVIALLGYFAYGDFAQAPVTLNLPRDGVTTFANLCLLVHVVRGPAGRLDRGCGRATALDTAASPGGGGELGR